MRKLVSLLLATLFGLSLLLVGCPKKDDKATTQTPEGQAQMKANMMKGMDMMKKGAGR